MLDWRSRHTEWQGTAEDLDKFLPIVAKELAMGIKESTPNVRLIRHYVSAGAVSRPERRGKEAIFGFRQVVECLVVRLLLDDGWPLAKIAAMTGSATVDDLMKFLPTEESGYGDQRNRAQALVAEFESGAPSRHLRTSHAVDQASRATRRDIGLQYDLLALGSDKGEAGRVSITRLLVAPWCHVDIEEGALGDLTKQEIDRAGEMLKKLLRSEQTKRGGRK